jgi:Flp pilus assembly protein TadD
MILPIIIVLALLLVALLVDWRKITSRFNSNRPKKKVAPSAKPVLRKTDYEKAEQSADRFSMEDFNPELEVSANGYAPTKEVETLLAEADIHFRKGEIKAAEKLYLQAAAKDPKCSKAYSRLGVIYLENGEDWEDAEAAFRQALKMDGSNGYVLNNLGLVLYHQDKYADAIRNFEQAVRQDEMNPSRHANLGMAYMAMRQYAKAESSFKKALKLAPNEMEYKDLLDEAMEKKVAHKAMIRR